MFRAAHCSGFSKLRIKITTELKLGIVKQSEFKTIVQKLGEENYVRVRYRRRLGRNFRNKQP